MGPNTTNCLCHRFQCLWPRSLPCHMYFYQIPFTFPTLFANREQDFAIQTYGMSHINTWGGSLPVVNTEACRGCIWSVRQKINKKTCEKEHGNFINVEQTAWYDWGGASWRYSIVWPQKEAWTLTLLVSLSVSAKTVALRVCICTYLFKEIFHWSLHIF